jgi:large repetitive protein
MKTSNKYGSAAVLGALLIADITSSLTPKTYAESSGYACYAITVNTPTLPNICVNTPIPTTPILCFPEGTTANLPVYFHTSRSIFPNNPYPYRNLTTVTQNTAVLPSPVTTFSLGTSFANSPIPVTYTINSVANSTNGTVSLLSQNSVRYTPNVGFTGNDISTYTMTDANGIPNTGKFLFKKSNGTQIDQITRPIGVNVKKNTFNANVLSSTTNQYGVSFGPNYTPTITTQPTNGTLNTSTFDSNGNVAFNYTPNPGFTGEDTFFYTLTDNTGTSTPTQALIQVYDPATRPIGLYFAFDLGTSSGTIFDLTIYRGQTGYEELFKSGPETTNLSFTAPQVSSGSIQIPIDIRTVFDNIVFSSTVNYKKSTIVQVDNTTNTAPIISSIVATNPAPDKVNISVTALDNENNQGNFTAEISDDNFATFSSYPIVQNLLTGTYSIQLSNLPTASYSVRVVAQETNTPGICTGFSNAQLPTYLRSTSTARPFDIVAATLSTAVTDNYTTTTPSPVVLTPLTGDTGTGISLISINSTTLIPNTAQSITVPNGLVEVLATGEISFTPDINFTGQTSFQYEIQNINGVIATADQIITINPKATDDIYTITAGAPIILDPLALDTTGTTIKSINGIDLTPGIAQTILVPHGSLSISILGIITFTPDPNFSGQVIFPYSIQNTTGQIGTANQSIAVTVSIPFNIAPSTTSSGVGGLGSLIRTGGSSN